MSTPRSLLNAPGAQPDAAALIAELASREQQAGNELAARILTSTAHLLAAALPRDSAVSV